MSGFSDTPSQFNPGLGNGLIPNVLIANQSYLSSKTHTGRSYLSKNLPKLFGHFKLQCSDLRAIARTNSVFGKESCDLTQDPEICHSAALHIEVWNAVLRTRFCIISRDSSSPQMISLQQHLHSQLVHQLAKSSLFECDESSLLAGALHIYQGMKSISQFTEFSQDHLEIYDKFRFDLPQWLTTRADAVL